MSRKSNNKISATVDQSTKSIGNLTQLFPFMKVKDQFYPGSNVNKVRFYMSCLEMISGQNNNISARHILMLENDMSALPGAINAIEELLMHKVCNKIKILLVLYA